MRHSFPVDRDDHATKAKRYLDEDSYVSTRVHPETQHQCEYLAGKDASKKRAKILEREGHRCYGCGKFICWQTMHLAHGGHTKVERCWCDENLKAKCYECHIVIEHGRLVGGAR